MFVLKFLFTQFEFSFLCEQKVHRMNPLEFYFFKPKTINLSMQNAVPKRSFQPIRFSKQMSYFSLLAEKQLKSERFGESIHKYGEDSISQTNT